MLGGAAGLVTASRHSVERLNAGAALVLGGALAGQFGERLPDILEPADHPKHRGRCHSLAAGRLVFSGITGAEVLTALLVRCAQARSEEREALPRDHPGRATLWLQEIGLFLLAGAVAGFLVGYLSHLAADAGSPDGLPLV